MKDVIYTFLGGLLFSVVIGYIILKGGGNRIDPKKLEKIRSDINKKPLRDVIDDLNGWLS